ncbi:class I SAM-dependent methyltransferase [Legionella shakespearei]|uniref:Methyltransferase type 12 domain-containing protein n=1 Tax=Legionella shakespearei DSM 23087 TaxID=1122169 RepID=A0A0W0YZV1_9GAMM|nr:class I SAM-dependent methyltransferase [Legionella shakespearei]KTD62392.1 hypothetical protein Lsha_1092 [Legionella shakespearei DSM 23087]
MSIYNHPSYFQTYLEHASEKKVLADMLPSRILRLSQFNNLLDVGCHTGDLLDKILSQETITTPLERIVGIDPANTRDEFLEKISHLSRSTRFIQMSLENYFKHHQQKFDVILASQCLYWSEDLANDLISINKHGRATCIVIRSDTGIYQIQHGLKRYLGNKQEKLYYSRHIETTLNRNNILFQKDVIESPIYMPQKGSQEWLSMLSFFLQNDHSNFSNEALNEINNFLDKLIMPNNIIKHEVVFYWLGEFIC